MKFKKLKLNNLKWANHVIFLHFSLENYNMCHYTMQFTTDQLLYKLKCTKNLNQEHTILEPTSFTCFRSKTWASLLRNIQSQMAFPELQSKTNIQYALLTFSGSFATP
jgi:hypothetical protein